MPAIETAVFRLNPAAELVLYDRLDSALRARLADLGRNPDFYGVVRDPVTGSTKAVDRDSALLLLTMRTPGRLPRYALRLLGAGATRTITGFVLDGVLEIDVSGTFVSGPAAADALAAPVDASGVDALSLAALRSVAALPIEDATVLARRLYAYNRLPLTPRHRRTAGEPDGEPWRSWSAHGDDTSLALARGTFKLYVSPAVDDVPAALDATAAVAARTGALAWKVGVGPYGLLRPDKLIVYFGRWEGLHAAAHELRSALAGMRAHGVPFTAALTADGLLSWGVDPPADIGMVGWLRSESWRTWLTDRLAAGLVAGRAAFVDPVTFALRRIAATGVDPRTWAPDGALWAGAAGVR